MYSTCLFCNTELGANESIEHFPVGRRLAYDTAKGRLWVVCRKCERWNLSPLETRWEAIEEAERAFRGTKLRVSTDNIGLAQLRDGTELVRIGAPIRAEFAAWRYGDQFGRRWRKYAIGSAAVTVWPIAQAVTQVATIANNAWLHGNGIGASAVIGGAAGITFTGIGFSVTRTLRDKRPVGIVRDDNGEALRVSRTLLDSSIIMMPEGGRTPDVIVSHFKSPGPRPKWKTAVEHERDHRSDQALSTLTGDNAMRALTTILPHVNRLGGSRRTVQAAVESINNAESVSDILKTIKLGWFRTQVYGARPDHFYFSAMPAHVRFALEMTLHESDERRAMEGELHELELRWKEADAIAKIADEMFLPESIAATLERLGPESRASRE